MQPLQRRCGMPGCQRPRSPLGERLQHLTCLGAADAFQYVFQTTASAADLTDIGRHMAGH